MKTLFSLVLLLYCSLNLVCGTFHSHYIKTNVISENYRCSKNEFNLFLKKMKVPSLAVCGFRCTEEADCRRIMYDLVLKVCMMYESGENCYAEDTRLNDVYCFKQENICDEVSCPRCPVGYYGDRCQHIIKDCNDGYNNDATTRGKSLRSYIKPKDEILEVNCIFSLGGMTIISHRRSLCLNQGSANFSTGWENYKTGFGPIHGNYWLGLEHIYNLLQNNPAFHLMVMARLKTIIYQCAYRMFQLADQTQNYTLTVGNYEASPDPALSLGDALTDMSMSIDGRPFSTYDRDFTSHSCPQRLQGGWWFANKFNCSLAEISQRSKRLIWRGVTYDEIQLRLI